MLNFFFSGYGDHRDLNVLTHSFPTRRSSDLAGYFGVAPGTSDKSNPNALASIQRDTIFTNVAVTDDNQPWWEGLDDRVPVKDWPGRDYVAGSGQAAHPTSRFTVRAKPVPSY